MKSTIVFATAQSRLQADIMMIRLRRAGIDIDRVSAIFSNRFAPNSFFFWLRSPRPLRSRARGDSFYAAGPLQRYLGGDEAETMPRNLRRLGLNEVDAARFSKALWLGNAMLCLQAKNQDEAAIAWHIFERSRAEDIAISDPMATERVDEPVADSLPHTLAPAFAA